MHHGLLEQSGDLGTRTKRLFSAAKCSPTAHRWDAYHAAADLYMTAVCCAKVTYFNSSLPSMLINWKQARCWIDTNTWNNNNTEDEDRNRSSFRAVLFLVIVLHVFILSSIPIYAN